jgi:hypothetical protein
MDAMVRFVRDRNVVRFVDRLRLQYDPTIRAVLQRLLLEEVRKLGSNFEQLSMVDRQISEARERIRAQTDIIERLRIKGRGRALAGATRSNTINRFFIKNGNGDAATRLTSEALKVR